MVIYSEETKRKAKEHNLHPNFFHYAEMQRNENKKILNKTKRVFDLTATLGVLGFVFGVIQLSFLFEQNGILKETNKIMQIQYNYQLYKDSLLNESHKNKTIKTTPDTVQQPPL